MSTMTAALNDQPVEITVGTRPQEPARSEICGHPLWGEEGGLRCIQPPGHYPRTGHVYHDPTGSEIDAEPCDPDHG